MKEARKMWRYRHNCAFAQGCIALERAMQERNAFSLASWHSKKSQGSKVGIGFEIHTSGGASCMAKSDEWGCLREWKLNKNLKLPQPCHFLYSSTLDWKHCHHHARMCIHVVVQKFSYFAGLLYDAGINYDAIGTNVITAESDIITSDSAG